MLTKFVIIYGKLNGSLIPLKEGNTIIYIIILQYTSKLKGMAFQVYTKLYISVTVNNSQNRFKNCKTCMVCG